SHPRHQGIAPGSEAAVNRDDSCRHAKSFEVDNGTEQQHNRDGSILAHDESSAITVLASFVPGALVGAAICVRLFIFAPFVFLLLCAACVAVMVVFLCGAGAAVVTKSHRKVETNILPRCLQFDTDSSVLCRKHSWTVFVFPCKVEVNVQEAAGKVQAEMQKVGICDHVMTRARSLWDQVDKRTAPGGQLSKFVHGAQGQDTMGLIREEPQPVFDDAADTPKSAPCSPLSSGNEKAVPAKASDA
ncbi:unnamed protein product, partial [Ectocarpus sp. 13 AM-2016]